MNCVIFNMNCVICNMNCVICNMNCVICNMNCVICNMNCLIFNMNCVIFNMNCVIFNMNCVICNSSKLRRIVLFFCFDSLVSFFLKSLRVGYFREFLMSVTFKALQNRFHAHFVFDHPCCQDVWLWPSGVRSPSQAQETLPHDSTPANLFSRKGLATRLLAPAYRLSGSQRRMNFFLNIEVLFFLLFFNDLLIPSLVFFLKCWTMFCIRRFWNFCRKNRARINYKK